MGPEAEWPLSGDAKQIAAVHGNITALAVVANYATIHWIKTGA